MTAARLLAPVLLAAVPAAAGEPSPEAVRAYQKSLVAYESAQFDAAVSEMRKAIALNPGWRTATAYLSMFEWTKGDREGADRDAKVGLKLQPNSAESHVARGFARYVAKDLAGAEKDFEEAQGMDPKHALALFGQGSAMSSQGRSDEAIQALSAAIKLRQRALFFIVRGTVYDKLRRFANAAEDYDRALELNPDFQWGYWYRGKDYREIGERGKALSDFTKFLTYNPDNTEALYLRSNVYFSLGNYDEAIHDLDKVLAIDPRNGLALSNRGLAKSQVGDREGALADLRLALKISPNRQAKIQAAIDMVEGKASGQDEPKGFEAEPKRRRATDDVAPPKTEMGTETPAGRKRRQAAEEAEQTRGDDTPFIQ
ncbi:MAG: tetratricopeptide repeat protein [Elusimicrobia bacterium]|nr:tetratricopeptide repeat protein [Elusimicrobiota bacterium]